MLQKNVPTLITSFRIHPTISPSNQLTISWGLTTFWVKKSADHQKSSQADLCEFNKFLKYGPFPRYLMMDVSESIIKAKTGVIRRNRWNIIERKLKVFMLSIRFTTVLAKSNPPTSKKTSTPICETFMNEAKSVEFHWKLDFQSFKSWQRCFITSKKSVWFMTGNENCSKNRCPIITHKRHRTFTPCTHLMSFLLVFVWNSFWPLVRMENTISKGWRTAGDKK